MRSNDERVSGERFIRAWINLEKFPGSMMISSGPDGTHRYGPVPAMSGCMITTDPGHAEEWRSKGQPVMEISAVQPT